MIAYMERARKAADYEDYGDCTARRDFYAPAAECERCGRMDYLKVRDGLMACFDCQEELDRAAWIAKHEAPLTGDKALLYSDDQPVCLQEAYEHGETEEKMLSLLIAHMATCKHCNPAAIRCERKAA